MKTTITKLQDGKEEKKRRRMWGWKRIKLGISSLSNYNHQRREEKEEDVGRKRIKLGISNLAGDGSN